MELYDLRVSSGKPRISFFLGWNDDFKDKDGDGIETEYDHGENLQKENTLCWKYSMQLNGDTVFLYDEILKKSYPCFAAIPESVINGAKWLNIKKNAVRVEEFDQSYVVNFSDSSLYEDNFRRKYYEEHKDNFDDFYLVHFSILRSSGFMIDHVVYFDKKTLQIEHWHCLINDECRPRVINYLLE